MTRFARAKGSKASNERVPEEATSWTEMKQQLLEKNKEFEENKKRAEVINQRNANYKTFLEEKEITEGKKTTWADFPGVSKPKNKKKLKENTKSVNKISVKSKNNNSFNVIDKQKSLMNEEVTLLKSNKVLNDISKTDSDSDAPPEEQTAKKEVVKPLIKIRKTKQKKPLKIIIDKKSNTNLVENGQGVPGKVTKKRKENKGGENVKKKLKREINGEKEDQNNSDKKKTEDVIKKKKIVKENLTEKDLKKIQKKKERRLKQVEKKKMLKAELKKQKEEMNKKQSGDTEVNGINGNQTSFESRKKSLSNPNVNKNIDTPRLSNKSKNIKKPNAKLRDKEEHPRKKPFLPHKMFINGKELEIEYVDGFPVKKEDAQRLKKLRKEMISKGLPRSEINVALKLERRKAEKAFAREKKKVCFNCRKSGHNLSECPELNKNQVAQTAGSGICFKCGSTEHTHFECKVVRGQEFKFAQCFICNEQGHIARQCPDNAKGLYPKGGACKVCGDVTHLKKDCPKYQEQQQQQESNINIETLGDVNPDVLENSEIGSKKLVNKKPNKIIKF